VNKNELFSFKIPAHKQKKICPENNYMLSDAFYLSSLSGNTGNRFVMDHKINKCLTA